MGAGKQPKQQKPNQNKLSSQQVSYQGYQGAPFPGAPQPFSSGPQYPMPPLQYQQPQSSVHPSQQQQTIHQFTTPPMQNQQFFGPPQSNPQYFQGPPPQPGLQFASYGFQNAPSIC